MRILKIFVTNVQYPSYLQETEATQLSQKVKTQVQTTHQSQDLETEIEFYLNKTEQNTKNQESR